MGKIFSKWKKNKSTVDVLEELTGNIDSLERSRQSNVDKQRQIITSFIIYSVIIYIVGALLLYFYYMPKKWTWKIVYSLPLLFFPFLVWAIKKFLHWFFVKRIRSNELALEALKERKQQILDEVMDKETYKKAKEILQRFDPERFPNADLQNVSTYISPKKSQDNIESSNGLKQRFKSPTTPLSATSQQQQNQQQQKLLISNMSQLDTNILQQSCKQPMQQARFMQQQPQFAVRPPQTRPFLKRDRTMMDRLVDYLLGDGPQNRYALICKQCHSHNGMALKEEFEYLSFRCSYCFAENPARKQKPAAPKLADSLSSTASSAPLATTIDVDASLLNLGKKEEDNKQPTNDGKSLQDDHVNYEPDGLDIIKKVDEETQLIN